MEEQKENGAWHEDLGRKDYIVIIKNKDIIRINKNHIVSTRLIEEDFFKTFKTLKIEIETTSSTYSVFVDKYQVLRNFKINFMNKTISDIAKEIKGDQGIDEYLLDVKNHNMKYFYKIISTNIDEDIRLQEDDIVSFNICL